MAFDWRTYEKKGIRSVDECAQAILACLIARKPLKAIHLWPSWYNEFLRWAEKQTGEKYEHGVNLQFDSVDILLGERSQKTPLLLEEWKSDTIPEKEIALHNKIKGLKKYSKGYVKKSDAPIMKLVTKLQK